VSVEERAADFKRHISNDLTKRLRTVCNAHTLQILLDEVVDDVMFHVEHLLVEIDDLKTLAREEAER
jgi:hypothetical protein